MHLVTKDSASSTNSGGEKYKVRVIERAFGVLDALHGHGPQLTLSEIAEHLDLHKSTVHRLLMVLERQRFVERNPRNSKYQLGLRLFELGWSARANRDVPELAAPFLRRLVAETGETAHLCVLHDGKMLSVANAESPRALRTPSTVGRRVEMYCTSVGKCILAFMDDAELEVIVTKQMLRGHTRKTITSLHMLRVHLQQVREKGYAMDDEEFEEGLRCIGAPVWDCTGKVIAALSIAGPTFRVTKEAVPEMALLAMSAAEDLSQKLGYRGETTESYSQ